MEGQSCHVVIGALGEEIRVPLTEREAQKYAEAGALAAQESQNRQRCQALLTNLDRAEDSEAVKDDPDIVRIIRMEAARRKLLRAQMPDADLMKALGIS